MKLLLLGALAVIAGAQVKPEDVDTTRFYQASTTLSLSGAGGAVTVQLPASTGSAVYLQSALLTCTVNAVLTQERNGSAATATLVTPVALNGGGTPAAKFYTSSNSTGGAALTPINLTANVPMALDMTVSAFNRNKSTVQNHTFRISTITGSCTVGLIWGER